ncbi:MAG: DUF4145 domain-containing protein [Candidatus Thiodiazotropha endolucinida]
MKITHVNFIKEKLGTEAIHVLQALFDSAKGQPPSVVTERFRADNHKWLDLLDKLEYGHFLIKRDSTAKNYLIKAYALPLIDTADSVLAKMQHLYERMTELYPIHLSEQIDVSILIDDLEGKKSEWLDALYYLIDISGVWSGISSGFPYEKESSISISENILRNNDIAMLISKFYEWNYVNPANTTTDWHLQDSEGNPNTVFFAQEVKEGFPAWYDELDLTMKSLIREIDKALLNNMNVLATIGLRTLLDMAMVDKVGDLGTFKQKLDKFTHEGYATPKGAELISGVLDAGNAAAHRAYSPNEEDIGVCVIVVKHMMEGIYILQPKIRKVTKNTPQRGKKKE